MGDDKISQNGLLDLSHKTLEAAMSKGVDQGEVFFQYRHIVQIMINGISITNERETSELGFAVRTVKNGSEGFSYTNKTDLASLESCALESVGMASVSPPKPDLGLPSPIEFPKIGDTYSSAVANLSVDELISGAREMISPMRDASVQVRADLSSISVTEIWSGLVNSLGIEAFHRANSLEGGLFLVARDGEKIGAFVTDSFFTRDPSSVDYTEFSQKVTDRAVRNIDAVKAPSIDADTVIFRPDAMIDPLAFIVAQAVSADNVQQNRSFWKDRLADKVAVDSFNLLDDSHDPSGGGMIRPFDDEGNPTKITPIIKDGVLENFLFDELRAKRANTESTGNSWRTFGEIRYTNPPNTIFPNGPSIQPGDMSFDEMITDTKLGIIFEYFSGSSRPENGIFSGVAKGAQLVENGEITKPLTNVSIGGTVFDVLMNVNGIGKETKLIGGILRTPALRATGIKIAAQA